MKIKFHDAGFRGILSDPGTVSICAAEAQRTASELESETGRAYRVEQGRSSDRPRMLVRADGEPERVEGLDHETWMSEVWPRVGGAKWRPRS